MPPSSSRKRKAKTHDSSEADEVALSDGADDFESTLLNGIDPDSADEVDEDEEDQSSDLFGSDSGGEQEDETENEILSDEVPSDDEGEVKGSVQQSRPAEAPVQNGLEEESLGGPPADYQVTEDANGNPRYIYKDIEPGYASDDSDAPETTNTIGNIPLSFYDSYPHIGYDINGKKISRPAKGEALDALLDSIEVPKGWTGLTDPATGEPLELSQQELEVLKKIQLNEIPEEGYDPYPATIEYFTSKTETMPLSAAPEPKSMYLPVKI